MKPCSKRPQRKGRWNSLGTDCGEASPRWPCPFEERIGVLLNNTIQHRALGTVTPIARCARPRQQYANPFALMLNRIHPHTPNRSAARLHSA
jgi:hypothetical protein